jgi:hypothetical protein
MECIGITEERHEYHQRLQKEFSEPRQKNVTAALKRKKSEQEQIAARAVPESEVKSGPSPSAVFQKGGSPGSDAAVNCELNIGLRRPQTGNLLQQFRKFGRRAEAKGSIRIQEGQPATRTNLSPRASG